MYSPSGRGCSLGSEADTSAGQHLLPPPAAMCSLGLDSGDWDPQARAAGWPEGSGRSCWLPGSAAAVTGMAEHTPVWTVWRSGWSAVEISSVDDKDEENLGSMGLLLIARCFGQLLLSQSDCRLVVFSAQKLMIWSYPPQSCPFLFLSPPHSVSILASSVFPPSLHAWNLGAHSSQPHEWLKSIVSPFLSTSLSLSWPLHSPPPEGEELSLSGPAPLYPVTKEFDCGRMWRKGKKDRKAEIERRMLWKMF